MTDSGIEAKTQFIESLGFIKDDISRIHRMHVIHEVGLHGDSLNWEDEEIVEELLSQAALARIQSNQFWDGFVSRCRLFIAEKEN